jgi:hypothetical protein
MGRLIGCLVLSFILYGAAFGFVLERPLSTGLLDLEMAQKAARLATLPPPKLVILAGSNGPYSHSCAVISGMLRMPCENAGIAVGIGLDDVFARYARFLRPGDVVYMPMELRQYAMTRRDYAAGVDGAILLRYDKSLLLTMPVDHIVAALFCCDLEDMIESVAEMAVLRPAGLSPVRILASEYNAAGDRINTPLAKADVALLRAARRIEPDAAEIGAGYGTVLIRRFVEDETRRGVIVVGGLPTDIDTVDLPPATIAQIAGIFRRGGAKFLILPNHSQYPIADFYDSEDHLAQPCQYFHSVLVAEGLAIMLGRHAVRPSATITALAATCPPTQAISAARWPAIRAQASDSSSSNSSVSLRIMVPPSSSASTIVTARR